MKRFVVATIVVLLTASVALASWYDDYDAGLRSYRQHQWAAVVQKMTAAIKANSKEDDHARTYGAIFINYHPYYYRGLANLYLGNYEASKSDFERATGAGEINEGSVETLMERVNAKIAATTTEAPPPPTTTTVATTTRPPVTVTTPPPVGPTIDPALRQRATSELNRAKTHLTSAQQRKATGSPQYAQALQAFTAANSQLAAAKSNDDLNAVIAAADNVTLLADSALAPSIPTGTQPPGPGGRSLPPVFDLYKAQLRRALEKYFDGEFESAARDFKSLADKLPTNGWIWAFLGASQYSYYAFEADVTYKDAAMESFRKAKKYHSWKNGLPQKYFSKRIRRVFENAG